MRKITTLCLLFILFCGMITLAQVRIVNNNGNAPTGHYPNLSSALAVANDNDTIYVVGSPLPYQGETVYKTIVFIGAGYRPQKDINYSSKIDRIQFNSTTGLGNGSKILGFEITGDVGIGGTTSGTGYDLEIAFNYFQIGSKILAGNNCNIHDNIFNIGLTSNISLQGTNTQIHNNILSTASGNDNIIQMQICWNGYSNNKINNNHFLSATGGYVFGCANSFLYENNLFYNYSVADSNSVSPVFNSIFNNNVVFSNGNNFVLFGSNSSTTGLNYAGIEPHFQNPNPTLNGAFDFPPYNYNLADTSVGHNAGTDATDIGAFGGLNPFSNYTGMNDSLPQIIKLDLANPIIGQGDSLKFHATGYANIGDSIVEAAYFFDVDTTGTSIPIPLTALTGFDFIYAIDHDSLPIGSHTIGFRVKNSQGIWSFPEIRSFTICTISGALANFEYYQYGRDVIFQNNSTDQQNCIWQFGDGNFSNSTQTTIIHHYDSAGVFNACLTSNNACPSQSIFCKQVAIKGINSITPNKGGNIGVVTVTITGALFNDSTIVYLRDSAGIQFSSFDSSTFVTGGIEIQTAFDLRGLQIGKYDVIISVPGDTTFTVNDGFEVEAGRFPEPYVHVVGPRIIRLRNGWHNYSLNVGNNGNIDALVVPIFLAIPSSSDIEFDFPLQYPPGSTVNYDTVPTFYHTDTVFNSVGSFNVYAFLVPVVRVGNETILNFRLRMNSTGTMKLIHWAGNPMLFSDSSQMFMRSQSGNHCGQNEHLIECIQCLRAAMTHGCVLTVLTSIFEVAYNHYCNGYIIPNDGFRVMAGVHFALHLIAQCAPALVPIVGEAKLFLEALAVSAAAHSCFLSCGNYWAHRNHSESEVTEVASIDPNNKSGSSSILNSPYINSLVPINYDIHFENVDTATAPAQTIIIIDTLDKLNLDLSTFQLNQIGIKDTIVSIPRGRKSFTTDVDMRPGIPLIARITTYLNEATGIFTTSFISIDPITMLPTDNPLLGILLPNDSTGRGEGFVNYSVHTKDNIATGTIVNNRADIYFDENAPVKTPTWTNIIDDLKPQSQVNPLPPVSTSDSISINWAGSDNGPAGVYAYNVYYNINGGNWILWKYNTSLTTDTFVGLRDSTYGFYSVAIDSALNVEDRPILPDASTTISLPVPLNLISFNISCSGSNRNLKWLTSNDQPGNIYKIENSLNGTSNWITVGSVNPNTSGDNSFSFTDNTGKGLYYRLKKISISGKIDFSDILRANCDISHFDIKVSPNPAKNELKIVIETGKAMEMKFELLDSYGRVVLSKDQVLQKGTNTFFFNIAQIPAGNYLLKSVGSNEIYPQKIVIVN